MNFYNSTHQHYCGIELHARSLYVCIINQQGETLLHKEISANPDALIELITPYLNDLVLGVECMHCWYWVADFCDDHDIEFILGHALYMKAIHGGKTKNDRVDSFKIAALMRGATSLWPMCIRAASGQLVTCCAAEPTWCDTART